MAAHATFMETGWALGRTEDPRVQTAWKVICSYFDPITNHAQTIWVETLFSDEWLVPIQAFSLPPLIRPVLATIQANLVNVKNQLCLQTWTFNLLDTGQCFSYLARLGLVPKYFLAEKWGMWGQRARSSRRIKNSFCWVSCRNTWRYFMYLVSALFLL